MANLFNKIYTGTLAQYSSATKEENALYMVYDEATGVKSMYKGDRKVDGDFIIVNGAETTITPEKGVIYYISEFGKKEASERQEAVAGKPYVGFWDGTKWVALSDQATIDALDARVTSLENATKIDGTATEGSIGEKVHTLIGDEDVEGSVKKQVATAKSEIIGDATEDGDTLGKLENRIEDLESDDLKIATLTAEEIAALSDANVKEAYKLINGEDRKAVGDVIKVYKDSSVYGVKLTDEAIDATDEDTTEIYDEATAGNDPQYLSICYEKANGKYDMVSIELKKFITESEFANGLIVTDGKVSVNLGATNTYLKFGDETEGNKTLQANIVTLADAKAAEGEAAAVTGLADALDVKTVIEENEKVTAAALNDLNTRIGKNEDLKTTAKVVVDAINELKASGDVAVKTVKQASETQEVTVSTSDDKTEVTIGVTKAAYTAATDDKKTNGAVTAEGLVDSTLLKQYVADEIAKNAVYWEELA